MVQNYNTKTKLSFPIGLQIAAYSLKSAMLLKDASSNEFKTSNSAVIASVIDEMKRTRDTKVSP